MLGIRGEAKARLDRLTAAAPSHLAALGLEQWWADFATDWHRSNWLGVSGSTDAVATSRGVRPGDPLADVVFCSVFALYVKELEPMLELTLNKGLVKIK